MMRENLCRYLGTAVRSTQSARAFTSSSQIPSKPSKLSKPFGSESGRIGPRKTYRNASKATFAAISNVNQLIPPTIPNQNIDDLDCSFIGKTGAQIFYEMIKRNNVQHIFGYPGGAILPVFDAIYNSKDFDFVLPKHEQGAGHMAEGYARASGKPGVVLVTSGPGATNVITPMQDALSDGTPMVVFSGQVRTTALGSDCFQEADVVGISRSCTKWNVMVTDVAELPQRINEAFEIATSGRPGPVLVDLPQDVQVSLLTRPVRTHGIVPRALPTLDLVELKDREMHACLERAAKLLNKAKKPILYVGQGVLLSKGGPELLKELSHKCSIPVTTTLLGLGAFDELDDKALHMLGMHGAAYANMAMQHADVIVALGARFDERVTMNVQKFAPAAHAAEREGRGGIIHFEIVPKNINKVVQATEAIEGDVATNLKQFMPLVEHKRMDNKGRQEWFSQIAAWKKKWPLSHYERKARPEQIKPQAVIEELSDIVAHRKDKTYLTTGVGQHQMWAAQHFRWRKPRSMITSGGLGTMGYGLPAAIGAKVAEPDALVIDIDGDASFNMTLSELTTAAAYNIGVKVIVLNNDEQGMVTQLQNQYYNDRYSQSHQKNPDFVILSEAMHVPARRVSNPAEVRESLEWLVNTDGPALLEVMTDKKVSVLPVILSGGGLENFVAYDPENERRRRELVDERTGGIYV